MAEPPPISRRRFLSDAALAAAALGFAARAGWAAEPAARATVVQVTWPGTAALPAADRLARLEQMVAAGAERLTGRTGADAWRTWFAPDDTVGLKVNTLAARRPTSPDLTDVVARGVLSAGVPGDGCLVFDRFARELAAAGYPLGAAPAGYRIVATDQPEYGWADEETVSGRVSQQLSTIAGRHTTALLNLPVVKDHNVAGVTGALKNHCGNIRRPDLCHADRGDPYFADVAALPPLVARQRLVIGDALTVIYDGGPTDRPDRRQPLDSLFFTTDPVAHDVVAWQLIEGIRRAKGLKPLARCGRAPTYLQTAAAEPRNLGVAEVGEIAVVRVELG